MYVAPTLRDVLVVVPSGEVLSAHVARVVGQGEGSTGLWEGDTTWVGTGVW